MMKQLNLYCLQLTCPLFREFTVTASIAMCIGYCLGTKVFNANW